MVFSIEDREIMFDKILVPTDGSKASKEAVRNAVELGKLTSAEIHALYVMDMGDVDFVSTPSDIKETRQRLQHKGEEFVEFAVEKATEAGLTSVAEVRTGSPENEIIEYAEENGIDLIIMGKRGRSDPDKPAFGTITNRVIGGTETTVLTT